MTAYENLEVQRLQRGIPGKGKAKDYLKLTLQIGNPSPIWS